MLRWAELVDGAATAAELGDDERPCATTGWSCLAGWRKVWGGGGGGGTGFTEHEHAWRFTRVRMQRFL